MTVSANPTLTLPNPAVLSLSACTDYTVFCELERALQGELDFLAEAQAALKRCLSLAPGDAQLLGLQQKAKQGAAEVLERAEGLARQAEAELLAMYDGDATAGRGKKKWMDPRRGGIMRGKWKSARAGRG